MSFDSLRQLFRITRLVSIEKHLGLNEATLLMAAALTKGSTSRINPGSFGKVFEEIAIFATTILRIWIKQTTLLTLW